MSFKTAKSHRRKCVFDDWALLDDFSLLKFVFNIYFQLIKRRKQTMGEGLWGEETLGGGRFRDVPAKRVLL